MNLPGGPAEADALSVTPTIECGVPGSRGESGCLLRVPPVEALVWDLEHEIGSARRQRLEEKGGWWFAASYLDTVIDIVLRSFPSVLLLGTEGGDRLFSRDGRTDIQERLF